MPEYIEREALEDSFRRTCDDVKTIYNALKHDEERRICSAEFCTWVECLMRVKEAPTADVVEVVRCQDCIHAEPLERNCEISTSLYMHCGLWRGDKTRYVWHKYKKYFRDYSLVSRDDYCSAGVKMDGKGDERK